MVSEGSLSNPNRLCLSSGLGASRIGYLALSVGRSVKKLSKSLKQRDINMELETKYNSKIGLACNLSLDTFLSVCFSVSLSKKCHNLVKNT